MGRRGRRWDGRGGTHKPLAGGSNPPPATTKHSEGRRRSRAVLLRGRRISAPRAPAPVSGRFWPAAVLQTGLFDTGTQES